MTRYRPNAPAARNGVHASCAVLPSRGDWPLVLDYLAERFPRLSRSEWQVRMAQGDVLDTQRQAVPPLAPFRPGERLYYFRWQPEEAPIPVQETVLYQDEHLLVADKPHFLPVIPSGKYVRETLLVRLRVKLGLEHISPIHRIDRDTAGLVMFSLQPASRDAYQRLFRERRVDKTYLAVAAWKPGLAWPQRRETRIAEASHFMQQTEVPGPPNALTHIEPVRHEGPRALYRLHPVTGQRHQLRVHMAALGLPIENDGIYPELLPEGAMDLERPLQLLAHSIAFDDPLSGQPRHFTSQRSLSLAL